MFKFIKESQPQYPTRDGNEIIAKRLAAQAAAEAVVAGIYARHPGLIPAIERSRSEVPRAKNGMMRAVLLAVGLLAAAQGEALLSRRQSAPSQGISHTDMRVNPPNISTDEFNTLLEQGAATPVIDKKTDH